MWTKSHLWEFQNSVKKLNTPGEHKAKDSCTEMDKKIKFILPSINSFPNTAQLSTSLDSLLLPWKEKEGWNMDPVSQLFQELPKGLVSVSPYMDKWWNWYCLDAWEILRTKRSGYSLLWPARLDTIGTKCTIQGFSLRMERKKCSMLPTFCFKSFPSNGYMSCMNVELMSQHNLHGLWLQRKRYSWVTCCGKTIEYAAPHTDTRESKKLDTTEKETYKVLIALEQSMDLILNLKGN